MNKKGQALIESMILLSFVAVGSFQLIRFGLHFQHELIIDELIEHTLICKFKRRTNCISDLRRHLNSLHFKSVHITDYSTQEKAHIALKLTSRLGMKMELENELNLDLKVK